MYICK